MKHNLRKYSCPTREGWGRCETKESGPTSDGKLASWGRSWGPGRPRPSLRSWRAPRLCSRPTLVGVASRGEGRTFISKETRANHGLCVHRCLRRRAPQTPASRPLRLGGDWRVRPGFGEQLLDRSAPSSQMHPGRRLQATATHHQVRRVKLIIYFYWIFF